jgi:hypothetical protein
MVYNTLNALSYIWNKNVYKSVSIKYGSRKLKISDSEFFIEEKKQLIEMSLF